MYEEVYREDYRSLTEMHVSVGRFPKQVLSQKRLNLAPGFVVSLVAQEGHDCSLAEEKR